DPPPPPPPLSYPRSRPDVLQLSPPQPPVQTDQPLSPSSQRGSVLLLGFRGNGGETPGAPAHRVIAFVAERSSAVRRWRLPRRRSARRPDAGDRAEADRQVN